MDAPFSKKKSVLFFTNILFLAARQKRDGIGVMSFPQNTVPVIYIHVVAEALTFALSLVNLGGFDRTTMMYSPKAYVVAYIDWTYLRVGRRNSVYSLRENYFWETGLLSGLKTLKSTKRQSVRAGFIRGSVSRVVISSPTRLVRPSCYSMRSLPYLLINLIST